MLVDPSQISPEACYRLLTGCVVPRPVAWVTSLSDDGVVNLAPFSCFMFLSSDPPLLGFTVGPRRSEKKDTARNIHRRREYVVHIADETLLEPLHYSADEYLPNESEVDALLGSRTVPAFAVSVPRLTDAPVALECVLQQVLQFGRTGSEFFVGEIRLFHFRDGLCVDGKIDSEKLRPIGRLAGPVYTKLGDVIAMRPNRPLPGGGEVV